MMSLPPTVSAQKRGSAPPRILHARLNNFEVQAERLIDPALATRPIAIISSGAQNGTILALSQEATAEGLSRGMHVSLARKVSRSTVLLSRNIALYQKVQSVVYRLLSRYSPLVEPASYGQFFVDMSGTGSLFPSPEKAGHLLHNDIARQINLAPQVGISRNKLVSSIATQIVPADPVLEVAPGEEADFLAPLRSTALPASRERLVGQALRDLNLVIIREVQNLVSYERLALAAFSGHVRQITAQAQGIDTSLVLPPRWKQQSGRRIFERYTLPVDTNDEQLLCNAIGHLADGVGYQLRTRQLVVRGLRLSVHYTDGYESCAVGSLLQHDASTVTATLLELYRRANRRRNRIRAITIDATGLKPYARQIELFDSALPRDQRLSAQLDTIRKKYGLGSIFMAAALQK